MSDFARTRSSRRVQVELPRSIPRGEQMPGAISGQQVDAGQTSTEHIRFARQGFDYDNATYATGAHDNTGWSSVAGADTLKLKIGSSSNDFVLYVWGSFSWANNSGADWTGEAVITLYNFVDTDDDGIPDTFVTTQRSVNVDRMRLPNDGGGRGLHPMAQFVVPATDGAEWWVGMAKRVASGTNPVSGSQDIRAQTLMAFTCAFDPDLDGGLITDTSADDPEPP